MPADFPTLVVLGPRGHGVTSYARDLAAAVRRTRPEVPVTAVEDASELEDCVGRVHLHVTDALFGDTLESAVASLERLAARSRVTMTLHDLPQPSDGIRNLPRRADAYRRILSAAAGIAVNSRHEAQLLAEFVGSSCDPRVVPLGTAAATSPATTASGEPSTILLAGYLYPGKGHTSAIRAAGHLTERLGRPIGVTALGGISAGHDALASRLLDLAAAQGIVFETTGYLSDDDYRIRLGGAGVPLIAHEHFSASRSLLEWAEQGRRSIVVDTRYTREMAALRPGTMTLSGSDPEQLADALEPAFLRPELSYLPAGTALGPTLDDCAADYLAWWDDIAW